MKRFNFAIALLVSVFIQSAFAQPSFTITKASVGGIKVGSTIGEIKRLIPGATFARFQGEGGDEIEAKLNGKTVMWFTAKAGDENYDAPVKDSVKILGIEVYDERYKTVNGIGPGTPLKVAELKYGKLKHIWIEGLTGDEVATFWKHPIGIDFKIAMPVTNPQESAGIYVNDVTNTAVYKEGARISSVSIPGYHGRSFLDDELKMVFADRAGVVEIGMTLKEAKDALAKEMVAEFKRTSGGDGVAYVSVHLLGNEILRLFAGEDDPESAINFDAKIEFIEAWSSEYRTKMGVRPGMKLSDAEKIYGKLQSIGKSEIEAREFVSFENHPVGVVFRVTSKDSEAGIYADGARKTNAFDPEAYVLSISVQGIPNTGPPTEKPTGKRQFIIRNGSDKFDIKIDVEECDGEYCEGAGLVQILRKGESLPFQTISMPSITLEIGKDSKPSVNLIELYGENNSGIVFDDFDFDGNIDLAIRNGNNGAYGGPSYDVYLFSASVYRFVKNAALTTLGSENLGLFRVDKNKRELITFTKSGCCWHQTTHYRVEYGRPYKVLVVTEDATGATEKVVVTTEKRVDGIWKKSVRTKDMN
ncbi:MAG: hypothetical protein HKN33_09490 [Pyrinomonadaceae bacterium]|nr:hypothetical protein [Pyrinomonadaceae bacterium]